MATITLSNIQAYAQVPTNLDGRVIGFQINLARTLDVEPRVTKALMTAVDAAVATPDSAPQLEAFYEAFIIPYWCLSAYYRFIASHGTNVTQFGLVNATDPRGTFNQSSEESRATILRQIASDKSVFKTYLTDRLKEVEYTFDGVVFSRSETINAGSGSISAIKRRDRPNVNPFNDISYYGY